MSAVPAHSENCQICGNVMNKVFDATILGKYQVDYNRCRTCGFIQTESPYWLEESYSDAIAATDVGLVNRNLRNVELLEPIISGLFGEDTVCIDIGGGYGLLTRLLRDIGFDCYTWDKYCDNLFAKVFEAEEGQGSGVLLAFEVMEHLENPAEFVAGKMKEHRCKSLIFSTQLYSGCSPDTDWWYLSYETGQHISLFTEQTLLRLADNLGLKYYRIKGDTHLFTDKPIGFIKSKLLFRKPWSRWYRKYVRKKRRNKCKIAEDYEHIKSGNI